MDHKYKIASLLFSPLIIDSLKWFSILNTKCKFIPFIYKIWGKCSSEGFCSCWTGPMIEVDDELNR